MIKTKDGKMKTSSIDSKDAAEKEAIIFNQIIDEVNIKTVIAAVKWFGND